MKLLHGLRMMLVLFVAVLMPLELGHCALKPLHALTAAVAAEQHQDADRDCCPDSGAPSLPGSRSDGCCCSNVQLPAATAPATVSVDAPASASSLWVPASLLEACKNDRDEFVRCSPGNRTSAQPGPALSPQSPRSPPRSA
jgi:hypothetical protein